MFSGVTSGAFPAKASPTGRTHIPSGTGFSREDGGVSTLECAGCHHKKGRDAPLRHGLGHTISPSIQTKRDHAVAQRGAERAVPAGRDDDVLLAVAAQVGRRRRLTARR